MSPAVKGMARFWIAPAPRASPDRTQIDLIGRDFRPGSGALRRARGLPDSSGLHRCVIETGIERGEVMSGDVLTAIGGIGLFLFGMQTMTDALRKLGSHRLRKVLARFTRTPVTGAVVGAVSTAILQSSSATILTVIGFVGAGLMTFPQALGVVMGANVGTTTTSWLVAVIGIKLHLGMLALPLLFVSSLAMLLGRVSVGRVGEALAGFSLVFIGLDMMQAGVAGIEPALKAVLVPADTLAGRLALVAAGTVFTAVIQSSSAGVAAVLVLFSGGAIGLLQAGALVIGMDIGTTAKSVIVAAGKSVDARRTAYAHVGFNLATAVFAFAILDALPMIERLTGQGPTALTLFYTLFNLSGAVLVLPFAGGFARLVTWLVPAPQSRLPEPPDPALLEAPDSAIDTARANTDRIASAVAEEIVQRLEGGPSLLDRDLARRAVDETEAFVARIDVPPGQEGTLARRTAMMHRIDHLHRAISRLGQDERIGLIARRAQFGPVRAAVVLAARSVARRPSDRSVAARLPRLTRKVERHVRRLRTDLLLSRDAGGEGPAEVFALTDALRWSARVAAHLDRIARYGAVAASESPDRSEARQDRGED